MRHAERRKHEILGDRCGNCRALGPDHWVAPTWDEKGYYTCERTTRLSDSEYIVALEALLTKNCIPLPCREPH